MEQRQLFLPFLRGEWREDEMEEVIVVVVVLRDIGISG
jgi:hypothetical protein